MAEIIDILTFNDDKTSYFTIDRTKLYMPLVSGAGGSDAILQNAADKKLLQKGDNFLILTAGLVLPEGFMLSSGIRSGTSAFRNFFYLTLRDRTDSAQYELSEIGGGSSRLYMPMENYETAVDIFCDVQTKVGTVIAPPPLTKTLDEDFKFRLILNNFYVSMVNIPVSFLDGTIQLVFPFIKIIHNLPMIN